MVVTYCSRACWVRVVWPVEQRWRRASLMPQEALPTLGGKVTTLPNPLVPEQQFLPPTLHPYIHPWTKPKSSCLPWLYVTAARQSQTAALPAGLIWFLIQHDSSPNSLSWRLINLIWLVLISSTHIPSLHPSMQQTNKLVRPRSHRPCPDTHVG